MAVLLHDRLHHQKVVCKRILIQDMPRDEMAKVETEVLILKQLSPVRGSSRMELLEADGFVLQSFDTPTGLKFFVTADPDSKRLDEVLIRTYELYSDFVLKDPFYELEMPIRCESFDQKLQKLADDYHRR